MKYLKGRYFGGHKIWRICDLAAFAQNRGNFL